MVNNPSNIPGKVFSKEELQGVANLAKKHDLIVLRSVLLFQATIIDSINLSVT